MINNVKSFPPEWNEYDANNCGVQSDWNQNDDTQPDYVKNRPFYSETETVTVENCEGDKLNYFPVFAVGDTVTVNVDGVEYSLVAYDDNGSATIGDTTISIDNGEGQLGWQIYFDKKYNGVWFYATEEHTVSYLGVVYHKIDSKYLPDNPLNITGATVGQIAKITAVDDSGKPTAWEAVDMPSGGGGASYRSWSKVWTLAVAEDIAGFTASNIDLDGKSEIMIVFISDSTASRTMVNGRLRINGVDAGKVLFNSLPLKKDSHSFVIIGRADVGIEYTTMQATAEYQTYPWQGEVKIVHRMVSGTGSIIQWTAGSTIEITQASATLGQGITIEIYVR